MPLALRKLFLSSLLTNMLVSSDRKLIKADTASFLDSAPFTKKPSERIVRVWLSPLVTTVSLASGIPLSECHTPCQFYNHFREEKKPMTRIPVDCGLHPDFRHRKSPGNIHIYTYIHIYMCIYIYIFFRASPMACGGSQAWGLIGATAAGLCHSRSGSKPRL